MYSSSVYVSRIDSRSVMYFAAVPSIFSTFPSANRVGFHDWYTQRTRPRDTIPPLVSRPYSHESLFQTRWLCTAQQSIVSCSQIERRSRSIHFYIFYICQQLSCFVFFPCAYPWEIGNSNADIAHWMNQILMRQHRQWKVDERENQVRSSNIRSL